MCMRNCRRWNGTKMQTTRTRISGITRSKAVLYIFTSSVVHVSLWWQIRVIFFFLFVWRFSGALSIYLFLIRCIFLSFYIWWHHTNIDGGDKRIWQPLVGKCTEHHCGKIDRIISNAADAANDGGSVCFTKPAFTEITDSLTHINPLRAFLKSTILDLVWYTENLLKGSTKRLW